MGGHADYSGFRAAQELLQLRREEVDRRISTKQDKEEEIRLREQEIALLEEKNRHLEELLKQPATTPQKLLDSDAIAPIPAPSPPQDTPELVRVEPEPDVSACQCAAMPFATLDLPRRRE